MSFFKKIQKVLALLSPWHTAKPQKKSRKKTKKTKARSRIKKIPAKATVDKKQPVRQRKIKKATPKKVPEKIKIKAPLKRAAPEKKTAGLKKKMEPVKKNDGKTIRGAALKTVKLKRVLVGEVTHYFDRVKVGAFMVTGAPIALGDALEFEGKWGAFRQEIKSLQIDRVPVKSARAGDEVGLLVKKPVREGDYVFKVL